jgi:hypothetical protein
MLSKPDIMEVVDRYTALRKRGREFVGLAFCHDDRRPSMRINPEKQLWYCDPCARGGDVISFIQLAEKVDFKEACQILKIEKDRPVLRPPHATHGARAAILLAHWMNEQYLLVGALCRQLSSDIALAEQIPDPELVSSMEYEWEILSDLHEDLANPKHAAELWSARESIEDITADVELEPIMEFPPLADEYRKYLKS